MAKRKPKVTPEEEARRAEEREKDEQRRAENNKIIAANLDYVADKLRKRGFEANVEHGWNFGKFHRTFVDGAFIDGTFDYNGRICIRHYECDLAAFTSLLEASEKPMWS